MQNLRQIKEGIYTLKRRQYSLLVRSTSVSSVGNLSLSQSFNARQIKLRERWPPFIRYLKFSRVGGLYSTSTRRVWKQRSTRFSVYPAESMELKYGSRCGEIKKTWSLTQPSQSYERIVFRSEQKRFLTFLARLQVRYVQKGLRIVRYSSALQYIGQERQVSNMRRTRILLALQLLQLWLSATPKDMPDFQMQWLSMAMHVKRCLLQCTRIGSLQKLTVNPGIKSKSVTDSMSLMAFEGSPSFHRALSRKALSSRRKGKSLTIRFRQLLASLTWSALSNEVLVTERVYKRSMN